MAKKITLAATRCYVVLQVIHAHTTKLKQKTHG